ncbi:MAG: cobalamin biosynthesis protein [Chloroflexaceae bacterium]|nr:cobalamin biosynthesis protein [Chloroflexaceae bacterium]
MNHDSPYATRAATLLLAVALDWLAGEPPTRFHPVVWLGRGIQLAEQHAPRNAPVRELLYGTGMIVIAVGAVSIPAAVLEHLLMRWISIMKGNGQVQRIVIAALLLKPAFAWRTLHQAGGRVQQALASDNLPLAAST